MLKPESLSSTMLYQIAEPTSKIFLTKNISAMYMVALFGSFLFLKWHLGQSVKILHLAVFIILIALFFSRQAILAAGVLLVAYNLTFSQSRAIKLLTIIISILLGTTFFVTFFDFSGSQDGASQRLLLWAHFFANVGKFFTFGLGQERLADILNSAIGIDNYHMFFMNQIANYGLVHFMIFSYITLSLSFKAVLRDKKYIFLVFPYFLNIMFQTFGYEYQNLFLFVILSATLYACDPEEMHTKTTLRTPLSKETQARKAQP